jgi:tetratricopeptide (TPR) repeat protein
LKFKLILFFVLGFFLFNSITNSHAQRRDVDMETEETDDTTRKKADSLREERARIADSIRQAHAHAADSAKLSRKQKADSAQTARKHITDSTAAIRKYHDSKHYKDSVTKARNKKTNTMKVARQSHMDSLKDARKAMTDGMTAQRKARTDSIKNTQKKRTDSLAKIKKYKTSKRYADSVTLSRRQHSDSIKLVQKNHRDNIAAVRKHSMDSTKKMRKHSMDSLKTVRTKHMDSIKIARKAKTDSLAKIKKNKENLAKQKEKKKEEGMKLKLELKMKQKHEAWSNKNMLKKRWSPIRRFLQNSFTHYNYYYNAKKKMDEAQVNMQRSRKENYDSLIGLYPFDPNRDSTLLSADMDTIVRKISVGIQIHDPRVKWENDLYLLLGEAYYYRGNYENAAIAFRYIISTDEEKNKEKAAKNGYGTKSKGGPSILEEEKKSKLDFLKHKSVHNEAILWLARTYTEAHQVENAESILSLLESDTKLPKDLKGRLAVEKAFVFLTEGNLPEASAQLEIAADDDNLPTWLRMRAAFINAQILQNLGKYKESAEYFEKVLTYFPKIEMDFYARKYVAYNKLQSGENIGEAMKPLKRVLNDGKYVNYYDQVYFVLGSLAVKAKENEQAITYFTKSTTTPKATKKQKALSFAALGDVYFASANYPGAKRAYDSASKYSSSAGKDNTIAAAMQRSKGLEEISGPTKVIHDQDSLIELSGLSKKEQLSVVRRYIRDLEKKQQDSISNAENAGVAGLAPVETEENKDVPNWYFSNPTLVQQGSAEFKRKWGNRPLADNWRRASAIGAGNNAGSGEEDEFADGNSGNENGLPTEASLLAKIPNTPQQKELSNKIEFRAYIMLAKAYMKQLEDYNMATHTLDTLDSRFPNHNQKEEELYLRYQIAMKQNKLDKAKTYSDQLLAKFPNSQYANNVRPRQSESKPDAMIAGKTVSEYFDETYNLLLAHQYTEALMHINISKKQYNNPLYQKRFEVAEAMAYAGTGDFDLADTFITRFIRTYPADTLTPWANTVKQHIKEVRNGGKPSWYKETPPGTVETPVVKKEVKPEITEPKVKPTVPNPPSDIPSMYAYFADTPHYCIIILPGIDSRTAGLKKAVKDFNTGKYPAANLEMLFDLYNINQGVLVVKKLANAKDAKNYMNDLLTSSAFQDYKPGELQVLLITASNYKKMFAEKNVQPYNGFYNAYYK